MCNTYFIAPIFYSESSDSKESDMMLTVFRSISMYLVVSDLSPACTDQMNDHTSISPMICYVRYIYVRYILWG